MQQPNEFVDARPLYKSHRLFIAELIFWLGIAVPAYAYFGYPLTLLLLRQVIRRDVAKADFLPSVSLLIPAYNEARNIERKVLNSLALDYPPEQLEIVVACDGCKDQTGPLAQHMANSPAADGRVRVLDYKVNRGKIMVLNAAVQELKNEIIVFSDASAILNPDALKVLIRNFADPEVGSVSGKYTVVKADEVDIGKSEDIYWRYETFLKVQESQLASTLGGHGHLHAIRAALYPYPPPGTINDDWIIHMSVLSKGLRAAYEPDAVIREEAHEMTGFGRRVRIMAGNVQQIREIAPLLKPLQPLPLFFFFGHKFLRLMVPFAMLAALAANLFLLNSPLYRFLFAGQIIFYTMAVIGTFIQLKPKLLMLPYYFSMINAATFFGFYHAFTDLRGMKWK